MNLIKTVTLNPAIDLHFHMTELELGKENYVQKVLYHAGGKGINISRALSQNGIPNTAYVILGEENSAEFEAHLNQDGVSFIPFYTKGRIRENITLHPDGKGETRISLDTFCANEEVLFDMEQQMNEAPRNCLLAFAGRLPHGISKDTAIGFLKRQMTNGVRTVVDCNSFTIMDLKDIHPWLIKPNEQEIAAFYGRAPYDLRDAASIACELVASGVSEEILISCGGNGAAWSNGKQQMILHVPKIEAPKSTIGAGDSTLAGLLAATAQGHSKQEALLRAVAFGTASCLREGTLPPRAEGIDAVQKQSVAEWL